MAKVTDMLEKDTAEDVVTAIESMWEMPDESDEEVERKFRAMPGVASALYVLAKEIVRLKGVVKEK